MNQKRMFKAKKARLVLGTVQLGLPYGAANRTSMPSEDEAIELVRTAISRGVREIDTARAYGDAERRIGLALPAPSAAEITTKLDPLDPVASHAAPDVASAAARESLAASRAALGRDRLDTLLLHRAGHRNAWQSAVWEFLKSERDCGQIGRLGISVQTPEEAIAALDDPDVAHLQLPFNLIDQRWQMTGVIAAIRTRPDVTIHVRSVFLQGLLANRRVAIWPRISGLDPEALTRCLAQLANGLGRESVADLALAFVRGQGWIDGVVIGMETSAQLANNLFLFDRAALTEEECDKVRAAIPPVPDALLDPARWHTSPDESRS
jgi:spore coat polysaccharide biosynthesis protein SpsF